MKIKWLLLFLLLFLALGYFREFLFVHINRVMYGKYYNMDPYEYEPMPAIMHVFNKLSYSVLYYLKYPFTIIWTTLFYLLSYITIKKLSTERIFLKFLTYAYLALLVLAACAMAYGYLVNNRLQNDEYTLSRWLLGIAQSPIICLILLAAENLYKKSFTNHKNQSL